MKVHVALSGGPKFEIKKYTGDTGIYLSAIPTDSISVFESLADELGISLDKSKVHCTVMYSPEGIIPMEEIDAFMETWFMDPIFALVSHIDHWVGHDKKVYIVAKLVSTKLHQIHGAAIQLGAIPTFTPYVPHVTLFKYDDGTKSLPSEMKKRIDNINTKLASYPQEALFIGNPPSDIV